jgi:superfamily I DNA and/or RNA helicase
LGLHSESRSAAHAKFESGDHLQLRLKVDCYELSRASRGNLDLDVSLFERLVEETAYPVATLTMQRRMRPEISRLLRASLYPELQDHASTEQRAHVRGVLKDVVFLDHQNRQDQVPLASEEQSMSHTNSFEAKFVAQLVLYLLRQGYTQPGSIAVLTPYLGQLALLRSELGKLRHGALLFASSRTGVLT